MPPKSLGLKNVFYYPDKLLGWDNRVSNPAFLAPALLGFVKVKKTFKRLYKFHLRNSYT